MIEALQTAIYAKLAADSDFNGAVTGIYDKVPQPEDTGAASDFPYAVIGEFDIDAWATDDWSGSDVTFDVFVYSRYGGNREASQILDYARTALDRQTLTVSGQMVLSVDFESSTGVTVMADGQTRVGEISFSALLCP